MNVLILTGRFGMGHVKCAEAIKEEIKTKYQDANVTVIDFCDYCFPRASKLIYKGFELCVFKFYDAYNKLAKFSNHLNCVPFKRVIYNHMEKLMCTYSPDLVVADLPMCVQYFSSFKKKQGEFTVEDYLTLPDDLRVELIDGYFFEMSAPLTPHQIIARDITLQLTNYIKANKGKCVPLMAPCDVQLDRDDKTMVQPDVLIVCDRSKITKERIIGAPDFIVEVLSESTKKKDMTIKLNKYSDAGVKLGSGP